MTNKQKRMETLKANGVNVDNFFDLSMRIPLNADVRIIVNGKEMTVGQIDGDEGYSHAVGFCGGCAKGDVVFTADDTRKLIKSNLSLCGVDLSNDAIVKDILDKGYVFNYKTSGRWVAAETFRMLNEKSYNYKTREYEYGWNNYLKNRYPYMYTFTMMIDELHRLSKMERDFDPEFELLKNFFTKEVVYQTCKHYINQLKKFIKKQPTRKCKGVPYVKLNKYGDVFIKDLDTKVFKPLENWLCAIETSRNYGELECCLREFVKRMVKLPYDTPKCPDWKDAFKGNGAFKTLNNIIKHHNCVVQNYETGEILDTYGSVAYIESLLDLYNGEYWKFHELLKATIKLNNFDLKESIEAQRN